MILFSSEEDGRTLTRPAITDCALTEAEIVAIDADGLFGPAGLDATERVGRATRDALQEAIVSIEFARSDADSPYLTWAVMLIEEVVAAIETIT